MGGSSGGKVGEGGGGVGGIHLLAGVVRQSLFPRQFLFAFLWEMKSWPSL